MTYTTILQNLCYSTMDTLKCPHYGEFLGIGYVAIYFYPPFGDGPKQTSSKLTLMRHVLNVVIRRTLLPYYRYKEGLKISMIGFSISVLHISCYYFRDGRYYCWSLAPICALDLLPTNEGARQTEYIVYTWVWQVTYIVHEFLVYRMKLVVNGWCKGRVLKELHWAACSSDMNMID